jgi:hypothetical protein
LLDVNTIRAAYPGSDSQTILWRDGHDAPRTAMSHDHEVPMEY